MHLQPVSGFWQGYDVWPAVAAHQPAVLGMKPQSWARDESKYCHAPDAELVCGESVAVVQIGSEGMDRSQSAIGFGIWTAYLGEVKVTAHQKVQFNYRLGQVSNGAKEVMF